MGKEDTFQILESMKENLNLVNLMEKELLLTLIIKNMLVIGKMELFKEEVYSHGLMGIDMMGNMLMA
jgi:hypothetical protein